MVLGQQSNTDLQRLQTEAATIGVEGRNWIVYSQLLLTMFLWGLAWPVGRLLATNLPPVSIAVLRYTIVVPVLFGILRLKRQSLRLERKWIVNLVVMGVFSTTLYQIFFLYGVRYAAASDDSLVIGIGPVLIAIMASFVLKERLTKTKGLGFILGLAGIGVISLLSPNNDVLNRPLGISLVFGGAIAYAIYTVTLRRFVAAKRSDNPVSAPSSLAILAWISLFGWLFLIPLCLLEAPWTFSWSPLSWLLLRGRCLQDRSRKSSNLRQSGPSVRRHNLSPPTQRESQPMARSKLPTDPDGRGPRQQTAEEDAWDEIAMIDDFARPSFSTSLNRPELGQRRRVAANSPRPRR